MSGSVELRIIRQTILDGAPDYRLRFDEAVSFGNQQPITVARLFLIGRTVILNGTTHRHNLLSCKMRLDKFISFKNLSRVLMMILAPIDETEIMKCRYDINHIGVDRRSMLGEFQTLLDYHANMVLLMSLVEGGVPGNNLPLHIVDDFLRDRLQFQLWYFASFTFLFQNLTAMGAFLCHTFLADVPCMTFA